ncbi:MAG: RNA polymerase sigma factor [Acidobacteriota bacterium]|nr:RNA polymerase sigma factor [Acidobacteriota bacterium]
MDEPALISRAAGGDRTAFQVLVERHRPMVYRVAYQFAGNHHDADDIAQDVFIKVYQSLGRFRQDAQFTSWLYRIAMNACIDYKRRQSPHQRNREVEDPDLALDAAPDERPGPEGLAAGAELGVALRTAIDTLPPRQRLIFVMRHHEGLKLHEIASALGLADGTVKRQLHSAVHRLRKVLVAHGVGVFTS